MKKEINKADVNKKAILQKFPGKGGWTYVEIPEIPQDRKRYFGWVQVCGYIDDYEINHYKLMPMGNGQLFLPVKAAIRKKIKKEAGDVVKVILYKDDRPLTIPDEIVACFEGESQKTYEQFTLASESEQKAWLDWIYAAKKEETKANRILKMMDNLKRGLGFYNKASKD